MLHSDWDIKHQAINMAFNSNKLEVIRLHTIYADAWQKLKILTNIQSIQTSEKCDEWN